jgi:hypothetical protein
MWLSPTRRSADGRKGLASRAHRNVAIVAFANKLARIGRRGCLREGPDRARSVREYVEIFALHESVTRARS